jgi:hypothetical protein
MDRNYVTLLLRQSEMCRDSVDDLRIFFHCVARPADGVKHNPVGRRLGGSQLPRATISNQIGGIVLAYGCKGWGARTLSTFASHSVSAQKSVGGGFQ